jgi:alkylated DNA repair dioxygenase AlkB
MAFQRFELARGGFVLLDPAFVPSAAADRLLARLQTEIDWQQGFVRLFGRQIPEPRLTAWYSDFDYAYSGRLLAAAAWPALVSDIHERVAQATGERFNSVLLNRYRDGLDGVGFHSDDEPELGENPTVASLSFGERRRFVLRPKRAGDGEPLSVELGHGALLVMAGSCQHHYRHSIPKQRRAAGERINLTFRRMLVSSTKRDCQLGPGLR